MSYHIGCYVPSCDPEKPCDDHNQMNRRGGKTCRRRYTLPARACDVTRRCEATGESCLRFAAFHKPH
jgi:hypothetical protein